MAVDRYETDLRPLVKRIINERQRLFTALSEIKGLTPVASKANFMLVKTEIDPKLIFEELLLRDVLIRDVSSYPMLKKYFRVTVGRPEENDELLAGLLEICGE